MQKETSFDDVLQGKYTLTDDDIEQIIKLCGFRGRNKDQARTNLKHALDAICVCDILRRLVIKQYDGKWHYSAGQSYPDELRTVRKLILLQHVR